MAQNYVLEVRGKRYKIENSKDNVFLLLLKHGNDFHHYLPDDHPINKDIEKHGPLQSEDTRIVDTWLENLDIVQDKIEKDIEKYGPIQSIEIIQDEQPEDLRIAQQENLKIIAQELKELVKDIENEYNMDKQDLIKEIRKHQAKSGLTQTSKKTLKKLSTQKLKNRLNTLQGKVNEESSDIEVSDCEEYVYSDPEEQKHYESVRPHFKNAFKHIKQSHCKICGDTAELIRVKNNGTFCKFCYNTQINM